MVSKWWLGCVLVCVRGVRATCGPATAHGAVGDGETLNDGALKAALAACSSAGGGRVSLPTTAASASGNSTYLFAAPVRLVSGVTLVVDAGVTLAYANFTADWPTKPGLPSYGAGVVYVPLVYGKAVSDAGVAGGGTIDGRGQWWWTAKAPHGRPFLLACEGCERFTIGGVTLVNSPSWTVHVWDSDAVLVDGLRVRNPVHGPNLDGVDIDSSRNVVMRHLDIVTSDDHISIKSGANAAGRAFNRPSVNVTIEDSRFGIGAGLAVGSEMSGGVYNVTARRLTFGPGAHSVVRIKSARGRGGLVDNITFEDITAEGVDVPISVQMGYKPGPPPPGNGTDPGTPHLGRLTVRRLRAAAVYAGELLCLPEAPCDDIVLENVTVVALGAWKCENARPSVAGTFPKPRCAK